jgi:cyclin-dependent kinase 7
MRKSMTKNNTEPPSKRRKLDVDLAEQRNEAIGNKYVKGKFLGSGTYATVYEGHLRSDPKFLVAIKKFKFITGDGDMDLGLNVDTIREIKYLQELSGHPSLIQMYDIFSTKDQNVSMVLEHCPNGNLEEFYRSAIPYTNADIKAWMAMLCRGIYFCHSHFVLHRDIKLNNILIANDGSIRIADFGLARSFAEPGTRMTANVITLWYRPLELLFGAHHYSGAVDMWSIGCVFAELILRRPFIIAEVDEKDLDTAAGTLGQIEAICKRIGTPNEDNWPGVSKLKDWFDPKTQQPLRDKSHFMKMLPTAGSSAVDFLMALMPLNPLKRATAKQALQHSYFTSEPRPTETHKLPRKGGGGIEAMAASEVQKPGQVGAEDKYKGVARKLFN